MRYAFALSAALFAFASLSTGVQAKDGKYCLTQTLGQAKNCSYKTMAACNKSKASQSDTCALNGGTTSKRR
ncbi:MAG: DUF3551 domain-containing protein [Pseudolabrys sp.]|nr:DUF3551 domain-containing protein [Pseudolabrys sp.]